MISYNYPLIAREGWMLIAGVAFLALSSQFIFISYWSVLLWIMLALLLLFYRDPPRIIPSLPLAVVAPVDGYIVGIENCNDKFIDRAAICISIRKPWYNIMAIRSPMEGKVMQQWHERPTADKNQPYNKFIQWVQSDEADDVSVSITLLGKASLLRCYRSVGERIGQGQRCGVFPLSAVIDVMLPANSKINVKVGNKIKSGSDTIATLVHSRVD